jgi:hypothetical protein
MMVPSRSFSYAGIGILFAWILAWAVAGSWPAGAQDASREAQEDFAEALEMAILRESYPDKVLIEEFGPFVAPQASQDMVADCIGERGRIRDEIGDEIRMARNAELYVGQLLGKLRTAQSHAANVKERYNKAVLDWQTMSGNEADFFFRSRVRPQRIAWQTALAGVSSAETQLSQARQELPSIVRERLEVIRAIFEGAGVTPPEEPELAIDNLETALNDFSDPLSRRCVRLTLWGMRGAEEQAESRSAAGLPPPADSTDEGPPTGETRPDDQPGDDASSTLTASIEAAIANCAFKEAKSAIDAMPPGPDRDRMAARFEAAVERERKTRALWQRANDLFKQGHNEEAGALLDEAKANTQCNEYRGRIETALNKVRGGQTSGQDMAIDPRWSQTWKGELRTQSTVANGRAIDTPTLITLIDAEWARETTKAQQDIQAGGSGVFGGIFQGFRQDMGQIVIGVAKMLAGVMSEGVPWSFTLRPEGAGLRLAVDGDDNAASEFNKSLAALPVFVPDGERRIQMTYQKSRGSPTVSVVLTADETWARVNFEISASTPQNTDPDRVIQSLKMTLGGQFVPGLIPAAELQAELTRKMEAAKTKYAP